MTNNIPAKIYARVQRTYLHTKRDLLWRMGLNGDMFTNARGTRILVYHGICIDEHTRYNNIFLTVQTFQEHLKFYKRYFNVVSLADLYEGRLCNDRYNICITFDDGYANNHKYVLPLLERYQLPATFFITGIRDAGYDILWNDFINIVTRHGPERLTCGSATYHKNKCNNYVDSASGALLKEKLRKQDFAVKQEMMEQLGALVPALELVHPDHWLQTTEDQIKEMSRSPWVTIGAHGYYHNDLAAIPIEDARQELIDTKNYLERIIDKEVDALAFPYGAYSRAVTAVAKNAGYTRLLTLEHYFSEDHTDTAMRERFTINPFISANNQMYANITGRY